MNNEYTRAGGVWAPGTGLLSAELADLDLKTVRSVSGTGGAYYLEDDMVWTGDPDVEFDVGVETIFRGNVTLENDIFLTGSSYFYGTSGYYNNAYFYRDVEFNDQAVFNDIFYVASGADFFVYCGAGFYNNLYLSGDVLFDTGSDPVFNAPAVFNGAVTLNNGPFITNVVSILGDSTHAVQLRGATLLQNKLTMSGTGSIAHRVAAGDNVTTSYSPLAVHEVICDSGVLSGSTDWYIDDTGCGDGNEILFANKDPAIAVDIRRPGGLSLATLTNDWARFVRRGGLWELAQKGSF